ncbi:MAG: hypothetical protein K2L85_08380 [Paramuribaculum sp.]|nr:hypothetical protein [Paramuribaculum sp.]
MWSNHKPGIYDEHSEYGDDCLLMKNQYGNVLIVIVLDPVVDIGSSGKSKAKARKKNRR